MGLLDDLRKQAGDLQTQQQADDAQLLRQLMLAEAAADTVHRYLNEFARLLATLQPVSTVIYRLDAKTAFERLPLTDFRFDLRRQKLRQHNVIERIDFGCILRGGQALKLVKDFVPDGQQLEARLRQSGMKWQRHEVRDADSSRLTKVQYAVETDICLSARVVPDHARGRVHFTVNNLDGFEQVVCEFAAHEITQARMDEFGRWWMGQPHRFFDGALAVRRIEAR